MKWARLTSLVSCSLAAAVSAFDNLLASLDGWTSKHGVYFDRWFFEARVFVATEHFEGCFYIYCTCLFSHCNAPIVSQQ